jgi:ribokinase
MRILNFGSLNIDLVYRVPHIVRPGETIASRSFTTFAGGKGANQSVALGRAGAQVWHAGRIGGDGRWLLDKLRDAGVDTSLTEVGDEATGCAVIQVDDDGQNAIFLNAGANHRITAAQIDAALGRFGRGDMLLLQNEINDGPRILERGKARGMSVCLNPAPFEPELLDWPLDSVDLLIVNTSEAAGLVGRLDSDAEADADGDDGDDVDDAVANQLLAALRRRLPGAELVLTRGSRGVSWCGAEAHPDAAVHMSAQPVKAIDMTAAGDTFIGYFLAAVAAGLDRPAALTRAQHAAALCVTRPGAMDSIPTCGEMENT